MISDRMEGRVIHFPLREGALRGNKAAAMAGGMRDLDAIQKMLSSPAMFAFFDLPWASLFLAAVLMFHPLLSMAATFGRAMALLQNSALRRDLPLPH